MVVSASRIAIQGYQAPTPVTVVGIAQLQRDANTDIGDAIRQLPSVGISDTPNNGSAPSHEASQGSGGVNTINLRNLGIMRTLVLFDGQRVVQSGPLFGGTDLATIPAALVQRVDVVTGGASAAWGSDAVAGVVNLILNKTFTGFKADFEFGDNYNNKHRQFKAEGSWGGDFAGNRGHLIFSGTYVMAPDTIFYTDQNWFSNPQTLFPGPAGGPKYVHKGNYGSAQYTEGGLISSGPLKGIQFVGPKGTPAPFYFGPIRRSRANATIARQASIRNNSLMTGSPRPITTPCCSRLAPTS